MYLISIYSGKIKNTETGEIFEQDDRDIRFKDFCTDIKNKVLVKEIQYLDGEEAESKRGQIQKIDEYYTEMISKILRKPIEQKLRLGLEIPDEVNEEVDGLRAKCNSEIEALGVDVEKYRETNREVITLKIINDKSPY